MKWIDAFANVFHERNCCGCDSVTECKIDSRYVYCPIRGNRLHRYDQYDSQEVNLREHDTKTLWEQYKGNYGQGWSV